MLLLTVVAIVFVAALVHSTLGFGTALVAMPMLVALLDVNVATPLVGLTMLTTIALLLVRTWRDLDVRSALHLLVASIPGIPLGLLVLRYAPQDAFRAGLGILLIAIGLYNLRSSVLPRLEHIRWAHLFGFLSGVLGSAYNVNAAPVAVYGILRRWPPEGFRATLQGYFFPSTLLIVGSHALAGLWTGDVFGFYLPAVPAIIVAVFLGRIIGARIAPARFQRVLYVALLAFGLMLLVSPILAAVY
jgi:uncharacterized membrane protein YfcA